MNDLVATIVKARDVPTTENIEAMWARIFAIPAWYLLPSVLEGEATPLIAQVDGGQWLPAFTHFRTLNEFTRERNMRASNGEIPMLALSPRKVCEQVAELDQHLDGVVFNLGSDLAIRTPLVALGQFAEKFLP